MTSWAGGRFGTRSVCVLAPNPGPLTLDGTNTWVLSEPGARRCVVVDPGPQIPGHLDAVAAAAEERDAEVAAVLLTHGHADHAEAAREFAERMKCGVRALDPRHQLGGEGLAEGDVVEVDGLEVRVVATPGHTADSMSFLLPAEGALLTGDTVLGRGTTVIAYPDGRLGPYLASLQRLEEMTASEVHRIWPGHGSVLEDAAAVVDFYLTHRQDRLDQVRAAVQRSGGVNGGGDDVDLARAVVREVYADVDPSLWDAAELSVRAQLAFLAE